MSAETPIPELVEHLFRHEAGRLVARMCRSFGFGQIDLAEEAVQEALLKALRSWPFYGVPQDPAAWLAEVARNYARDVLRRAALARRKGPEIAQRLEGSPSEAAEQEVRDDQLAMIFACCHPALPPEMRVALTLKVVGGFSVPEIARALLARDTAVAQRIVRAKHRIRESGIALKLPEAHELPGRLDSVLQVIYLLFNEGYSAHAGEELVRLELCGEALRLGELVVKHPASALPHAYALLALMYLQASRLAARTNDAGDLLLLMEQDRSLWDHALRDRGLGHLSQACTGVQLSSYHLEAAIAAAHAVAPAYEATDWSSLVTLYDQLGDIAPSPVVALNRAVAISMVDGPEAGLRQLEAIGHESTLRTYYLLPAVEADFLARMGRSDAARESYRRALAAPCSEPERRFLRRRLAACERNSPGSPTSGAS